MAPTTAETIEITIEPNTAVRKPSTWKPRSRPSAITLVINALLLLLTSVIADGLDLGFHVDGFLTAVLGSIVISIVSAVVGAILPD